MSKRKTRNRVTDRLADTPCKMLRQRRDDNGV
jgi:hypothetical protein